jgi:hypothetical protein
MTKFIKNAIKKSVYFFLYFMPAKIQTSAHNLIEKRRVRFSYENKLVNEEALEKQFNRAIGYLIKKYGDSKLGDYLEFGVCHGTSIMCLYRVLSKHNINSMRLFGFDSFEGLPNDEENHWEKGQFKSDYEYTKKKLNEYGVDWNRVKLIKGWFNETLNKGFIDKYNIERADLIMVDCDMYSSAKEALNFCRPLIKDESIIVFDDWNPLAKVNKGEKRAFDEFLYENPQFCTEEFGEYSFKNNDLNGKIFIVRLTNGEQNE